MSIPATTEFSAFSEGFNTLVLSARSCGPLHGDGTINCADIETLRHWVTTKTKIVRIMLGGGQGSSAPAEWVSMRLDEFDDLRKVRRNGRDTFWLIAKGDVLPGPREVQPSIFPVRPAAVSAPPGAGKAVYFHEHYPLLLTGAGTTVASLHKSLLAAGLPSPFILNAVDHSVIGISVK